MKLSIILKTANSKLLLCIQVVILIISACLETEAKPVKVTILHWNDLHSKNLPSKITQNSETVTVGGAANLAGYLNYYRVIHEPVILLNAGDEFTGTPICYATKGYSQLEILNVIQPDAFTIGNHEFDFGVANMLSVFKKATFPVLLGNVVHEDNGELLFPADTILNVNGVRIGIIGVLTDALYEVSTQKATKGILVISSVDAVRKSLSRLTPQTDIQICLSHQGIKQDRALAEKIGSDLEIIVGGHSHTPLYEPEKINGVFILQAGSKGRFLGIAEMNIDTFRNRLIGLDARLEEIVEGKYPPDENVLRIVAKQENSLSDELDKVIGTLETPWQRRFNSESNIGNFIADAFRQATGADITFINPGGLRKNLEAGKITVRDILEICPFHNNLVRFQMTGKELFEYAAMRSTRSINFLQVSGMKMRFKDGQVLSLSVGNEIVQQEKLYSIATLNFVADHFSEYFGWEKDSGEFEILPLIDNEIVIDAVKKVGRINAQIENRIVFEP
ncbi:MAG: bifunctional UDP-sugar hydrolase/5'-nucleotidase [Candidatus Electryonea clarkiae]|nr:bifunctional UDP-sugar hydrolase/5'-nucleotidase [Candidatus Electryonea clarkiae]MDP8289015.1 bifunctional UDP-sugar hydrolase/5'-nucleotidase [Candidatus Electryonea clarkiae]